MVIVLNLAKKTFNPTLIPVFHCCALAFTIVVLCGWILWVMGISFAGALRLFTALQILYSLWPVGTWKF